MGTERGAGSDERFMNAVERLTEIQKLILELNREANRIRAHIRDFDVNMDALNILANVRGKDERGGGAQVLEDLIGYARQTGTQIDAYDGGGASRTPDDAVSLEVEKSVEHLGERASGGLWKLVTQLLAAAAVTSGLFVLVH